MGRGVHPPTSSVRFERAGKSSVQYYVGLFCSRVVESMPWDVFVSHNRREKPWVREFVRQLRATELTVFFDEDSVSAGAEFHREVTTALSESNVVVLLISAASVASPWVADEINMALHHAASTRKTTVIPVFLEDVTVDHPGLLQRSPVRLTDERTRDAAYDALLKTILESTGKPLTTVLPSPPTWPGAEVLANSFSINNGGKALAIGAHWDDVLLGCLGTLLRLKTVHDYDVTVVVLCNTYPDRYYGHGQVHLGGKVRRVYEEIMQRAAIRLDGISYNQSALLDHSFREKEDLVASRMEELAQRYRDCSFIFVPPHDDTHPDHAITGELANALFREPHQVVLDYWIKRYTDKTFLPNIFVSLDSKSLTDLSIGELKVRMLSRMVVHGKDLDGEDIDTQVAGAESAFGERSLEARLLINALDYSGDKTIEYGEVFRGRIML